MDQEQLDLFSMDEAPAAQTDMERMQELCRVLAEASRAYYQEARELMSNFEYDKLYDELLGLERRTGIVLTQSPTQKVGYEVVSELPKVVHPKAMQSLDKTKSIEDLEAFLGTEEGLLSWKLDGLTLVLSYENGELVRAATRGNGEIGEDVTPNARVFRNIPLHIPYRGELTVRGEAIMSYEVFDKVNQSLDADGQYKNPRNLCSGSVRQLNSAVTAQRGVDFLAYFALAPELSNADFENSKEKQWLFLKEQGFTIVEYERISASGLRACVEKFSARVPAFPYPVDGLVLALDNLDLADSLGATAKFPRHSIAFKWEDENAKTILREIEWNTSRTGSINPVAVFDPVELEGTTVKRASVHNVSVLEELRLGIGDEILVYKANMIIPQISENLTGSGPLALPTSCPRCGGEVSVHETDSARVLFCENPACPAKLLMCLTHFCERQAMNIEGLSEMTLSRLLDEGLLDNAADIFRLSEKRAELEKIPGLGEKSADKLIAAVEKASHCELWRFLAALGIPGIGAANAKTLASAFGGDLDAILEADEAEIAAVQGFGDIMAENLTRFVRQEENRALIDDIRRYLDFAAVKETGDLKLSGMTIVITGSLTHFANREELQALIEENGGKCAGSVSKNTSILINNDIESTSTKNKQAKSLNIPIMTEEDFLNSYSL